MGRLTLAWSVVAQTDGHMICQHASFHPIISSPPKTHTRPENQAAETHFFLSSFALEQVNPKLDYHALDTTVKGNFTLNMEIVTDISISYLDAKNNSKHSTDAFTMGSRSECTGLLPEASIDCNYLSP